LRIRPNYAAGRCKPANMGEQTDIKRLAFMRIKLEKPVSLSKAISGAVEP
jgi:hypothetical protein